MESEIIDEIKKVLIYDLRQIVYDYIDIYNFIEEYKDKCSPYNFQIENEKLHVDNILEIHRPPLLYDKNLIIKQVNNHEVKYDVRIIANTTLIRTVLN